MADFLSEKRTEIDKRLKELRPLVDEFNRLEQAKAALEGIGSPRRGPGRPRGSTSRSRPANGRRRRRGRRRGGRAEQALRHVRQNPGITVADLARKMNMKQRNYLYRIMANLQSDGAVKKQGRGFVAS